ncbi:MAG: AraC family transcriptional regulator [Bacteroidales bacterium]|nr:AraC family transcriptional regulator [Bacteroidales bacterium]
MGNIKKLLLSTDWSIQQVADVMGFPDQASLGQFFKRNEGVSPLTFRKSFR